MKVQVVFTIKGYLSVFDDVFEIDQQTEQAVVDAIKSVVGQDKKIHISFINYVYGDQNEQTQP